MKNLDLKNNQRVFIFLVIKIRLENFMIDILNCWMTKWVIKVTLPKKAKY